MNSGLPLTLKSRLLSRAIPGILTLLLGAFAFLPICDLHFDCGCTWPGVGGVSHCDIHQSGPPDCPWCDHAWTGYAAFGISAALALAASWVLPRSTRWPVATIAGLAAYLFGMLAAGLVTSWWLELPLLGGL